MPSCIQSERERMLFHNSAKNHGLVMQYYRNQIAMTTGYIPWIIVRQRRSRCYEDLVAIVPECLYANLVQISLQIYTGHSRTGNAEVSQAPLPLWGQDWRKGERSINARIFLF